MKGSLTTTFILSTALALTACSESGGGAVATGGGENGLASPAPIADDASPPPPVAPSEPAIAPPARPPSSDDPLLDLDGDGFPDAFGDGGDAPDDPPGDGGAPEPGGDMDDLPSLGSIIASIDGQPGGPQEEGGIDLAEGSGTPTALVGLWDASTGRENGFDVVYFEFTAGGEFFAHDYRGDEFAANADEFENCHFSVGGPLTALGNDGYRLTLPERSLEFAAWRIGERLVFRANDPGTGDNFSISLPPVDGLSPTDLNACD